MFKKILILYFSIYLTGCSTWKKETLAYMAGSAAICGLANAAMAPKGEDSMMHAALGAGICGAAAGATRVYLMDENSEIKNRDKEIESLKIRLSEQSTGSVESESSNFQFEDVPEELEGLIEPGSIKRWEISSWKKVSKNRYVHRNKILEYKPPKINIKKGRK